MEEAQPDHCMTKLAIQQKTNNQIETKPARQSKNIAHLSECQLLTEMF